MDCDPKRLLESSELTPAERSVLKSARNQGAGYDVARGLARFQDALAAPSAVPARSLLTKVVPGVVLSALMIGLYLLSAHEPSHLPLQPSAPATENTLTPAAMQPVAASVDLPPPAAAVSSAESEAIASAGAPASNPSVGATKSRLRQPAPRRQARSHASDSSVPGQNAQAPSAPVQAAPQEQVRAVAAPSAPQEPVVRQDESLNELRATARARALIGRNPRAALSLLDRLSEQHPQGYFVEERAALRVFALLAAGQADDAASHARFFLRAYPHSPFAAQLRKISEP
jgi:hypothetical protein